MGHKTHTGELATRAPVVVRLPASDWEPLQARKPTSTGRAPAYKAFGMTAIERDTENEAPDGFASDTAYWAYRNA
jgi:hypothetical protein